jgi:hypothetical protein
MVADRCLHRLSNIRRLNAFPKSRRKRHFMRIDGRIAELKLGSGDDAWTA